MYSKSMDLNITATTKLINSEEENNQLLFNAMKSKFDAKTVTETAAFSPPKFDIPLLKVPAATQVLTTKSSTQLNQFLIKQLQEQHSENELCGNTGFVLPNLNTTTTDNKIAVNFQLPVVFRQQTGNSNIGSLTTSLNNLKVQDDYKPVTTIPATIDLTTALSNKFVTHQNTPSTKELIKPQQNNEELDFEIPFIDCDRLDVSEKHKILLSASNEYCVMDVSHISLQHSLAESSVVGRLLSTVDKKFKDPLPLKFFSPQFQQQKVKHTIEPFRFNTKSPDDVVLLALSKYQMRHYN